MRAKIAVTKTNKKECLRDMETQAREIRESSNWIHRIVQNSHARNASEDSVHSGYMDVAYTNDCTCVVAQNGDLAEAEDGPSYELDGVPLIHRFGSHASVDPAESNCSTERIVDPQPRSPTSKFKLCMFLVAHAGMLGYLCALWQLLVDQLSSSFAWHPILMSISLVLATESIILMQYAPSTQSAHRVVGSLAALLFGGQLVFGVYMAWIAPKMGMQKHGKGLYKYHRAFGYIVLVVQWAGAWFGVHTKWAQSERASSEWTWLACFSALVVGVLVPVDINKFGVRQPV
ncbi:hypothetical protein GGH96_003508 [Coemansia sp. RSA 1972]|nr:hypothetical protein GGH96_003508 [Coemansia sp. RSA 1972]